jgi:hypothetical protein
MYQWLFGSFAGWLLRKQVHLLVWLFGGAVRTGAAGVKSMGSGKQTAIQHAKQDETSRVAGCKKVVLEYASAFGYIVREAMSKEELDEKIFTDRIRLCRKFCSGGREGVVAPVGGEIRRPGSRTVRPQ